MMKPLIALVLLVGACAGPEDTGEDRTLPPGSYGPYNDWYHAQETIVPEPPSVMGFHTGELAPNVILADQYAEKVELYQFAGRLILLDVFADNGELVETVVEGCSG